MKNDKDKSKEILLTGCGILEKEVLSLLEKNKNPVETHFLCSSLHVNFDNLSHGLEKILGKYADREKVVFYGCCHPLIDKILSKADTPRTKGQNCVDILLGSKRFQEELENGAFFLMEDWARRWDYVTGKAFGSNREGMVSIFQLEHKYLLGLRTPCSGDFQNEAEHVSQQIGLPLRWADVSLDNLNTVLEEAICRKLEGA